MTSYPYEGILVIDKPLGITSHDVVDRVRRRLGMQKVGHAGTLDPLATGVLIVLVGRSTKRSATLTGENKTYLANVKMGVTTTTGDAAGESVSERSTNTTPPTADAFTDAASALEGERMQIPPMYSAVKYRGERLYKLARRGREVPRQPRPITIFCCQVQQVKWPVVELFIECSKGTYIRSLAQDFGDALGWPSHLSGLRRLRSGTFHIGQAIELNALDDLTEEKLKEHLCVSTVASTV